MQNPKLGQKKTFNSRVFVENFKTNKKYVDINILLNRVKQKDLDEKKKKFFLFCIATLSISITGLVIF
ncbi:hypothetical protein IDH10_03190 [Pelagibacterales bacterium SAG-MED20]|nr:hypothetical protein [Pelagibacterales bacterium SAG-MED20]